MEINKISSPQITSVEKKNKSETVKNTGLKKDYFDKEKEVFNPETAKQFLDSLKTAEGQPKIEHDYYKNEIIKNVSQNPERWVYIKDLAPRENINPSFLMDCSEKSVEDLKILTDFASIDDSKGKARFRVSHLNKILKFSPEERTNTRVLSNSVLLSNNIIQAAQEKNIDHKKVAQKANEMADMIGQDNVSEVIFSRSDFSKGEYTIIGKKNDGNSVKELLDSKLNRYALETLESYQSSKGQKYTIKRAADYRNNTVSKIRYTENKDGRDIVTNEIRIVKDKNGKIQRTEYTEPSEISGVMNIKYVYPNGKTEQISSGKIDKKSGITTIKKNMTSSLGTRTEYLFEDDPQGNRLSDYKITDKNGNVLLQNSESFEVIDKNHFISSKNNQKYEITADEKTVTIKDLNKPERTIVFSAGNEVLGRDYEQIMKVLKKMPGEELFKLKENTTKLYGLDDVLDSYSITTKSAREIHTGDNLFVILHELGHAVDVKDVDMLKEKETINKAIFEDKKFNEIYEKEKAAFNKAFPDAQRNHIDYFINHETHYNGEIGGKKETIAESNALLTTAKTHEILAMRSQYLQQHFPETIAYLDKKLAEPAENPNRRYEEGAAASWTGH